MIKLRRHNKPPMLTSGKVDQNGLSKGGAPQAGVPPSWLSSRQRASGATNAGEQNCRENRTRRKLRHAVGIALAGGASQ